MYIQGSSRASKRGKSYLTSAFVETAYYRKKSIFMILMYVTISI